MPGIDWSRHSGSKIDAVCEIVRHEANSLGVRLRAVVLADRIRLETLEPGFLGDGEHLERLGVVPIFQRLRRLVLPGVHPAVLTGSLIILPEETLPFFEIALGEKSSTLRLDGVKSFVRIDVSDSARQSLVAAVTQVFEEGHINVLVGTTALLGEGWDAPALNTLILASAIGSYVTSNQMRGRAIRTWRNDPDKTANIWHLACIDTASPSGRGEDFETLSRRFDGYAGLNRSHQPPTIEEGFGRLGLATRIGVKDATAANAKALNTAENRAAMASAWRQALPASLDSKFRPVTDIAMSADALARILSSESAGLTGIKRLVTVGQPRFFLLKWFRAYLLRRRVERIATILLKCLPSSEHDLEPVPRPIVTLADKKIHTTIHGASPEFARTFSIALVELFDLNRSVRFVIQFQGIVYGVPEALETKRSATRLLNAWKKKLGPADLYYTGAPEGRRLLLRARTQALISQDHNIKCDTRLRWVAVPPAS